MQLIWRDGLCRKEQWAIAGFDKIFKLSSGGPSNYSKSWCKLIIISGAKELTVEYCQSDLTEEKLVAEVKEFANWFAGAYVTSEQIQSPYR